MSLPGPRAVAPAGWRRLPEGVSGLMRVAGVIALAMGSAGCSLETLGRNIPQTDLTTDYLKALVWGLALAILIGVLPFRRGDRPLLVRYWGVKLGVTLGAMLVYEYAYGLDAFHYFAVSQGPFEWSGIRFGNGTEVMFHLAWLHDHVVPSSYHAMKVTWAFLGMIAVYLFYRAAVLYRGRESPKLFWILALYPSVLFWSSIFGKDPLVLLGIALFIHGVMTWARAGRSAGLVWAVAGLLLAMMVRSWMGPILLAPLSIFVLARAKSVGLKVLLVAVAAGGFLLALGSVLERFNVESSEDLYMTTNAISRSWSRGGSGQQLETEFTSLGSIVTFMPVGVVTALFRPFPFEVMSPFGLVAGFENLVLVWLLVRALRGGGWRRLRDPVLTWVALTVLTWAMVYGFISFQNLGSGVRFRLQVLPMLLCVLLSLGQKPTGVSAFSQRRMDGRLIRQPSRGRFGAQPVAKGRLGS